MKVKRGNVTKKCSLFIKINLSYEPEWNKQSCRRREQLGWPQSPVGNSQTHWNHTLSPQQGSLSSPSQGHWVPWALEVALLSYWKIKASLSLAFFLLRFWQGVQRPRLSRLSISPEVSNANAQQQVVNEWNGLGGDSGKLEKTCPVWKGDHHSAPADSGNASLVGSDLCFFKSKLEIWVFWFLNVHNLFLL